MQTLRHTKKIGHIGLFRESATEKLARWVECNLGCGNQTQGIH